MLKYYVYISQTKVEMLYPQVPAEALADVEADMRVNLGVVSTGFKKRTPAASQELAARAGELAAYIRKHEEVGTPHQPREWFEATTQLRWGVVREYASDIALFAGEIDGTKVALLGSSESVLGSAATSESQHAPFYYTLRFFNAVVESREALAGREPPYYTWPDAVDIGVRSLPPMQHTMDFLARVLHTEEGLVVGTPLYVALG